MFFYADIFVGNAAALALWSPLFQRAVLNYFASITNRHSEQLDNNMKAG